MPPALPHGATVDGSFGSGHVVTFQPSPPSSGTGFATGMASLSDGSAVVGVALQGTTPRVERVSGTGVVDGAFHNAPATSFGAFTPADVRDDAG